MLGKGQYLFENLLLFYRNLTVHGKVNEYQQLLTYSSI